MPSSPAWTYLSTCAGYILFLYGEPQGGLRKPGPRTHTACAYHARAVRTGSVDLRMARETAEAECERLNAAYAREERDGRATA